MVKDSAWIMVMRSYSANIGPYIFSKIVPLVPVPLRETTLRYSSSSNIGISILQRQHQRIFMSCAVRPIATK